MMLTDSMSQEFEKSTEGKVIFAPWCLSLQLCWLQWPEESRTAGARTVETEILLYDCFFIHMSVT